MSHMFCPILDVSSRDVFERQTATGRRIKLILAHFEANLSRSRFNILNQRVTLNCFQYQNLLQISIKSGPLRSLRYQNNTIASYMHWLYILAEVPPLHCNFSCKYLQHVDRVTNSSFPLWNRQFGNIIKFFFFLSLSCRWCSRFLLKWRWDPHWKWLNR